MQISLFLYLLVTLTITSVTADIYARKVDVRLPVHRPEESDDKNPENVNVLLTTLFEMHHNLLAQISLLEDKLKTDSLPTIEKSEITHMVQHYTAQKNNIELSIQQIQSNDGLDILKARNSDEKSESAIETKSIPLLINFFKRAQNPTSEQTNANTAYSLAYQPSYYEPQPVVAPTTYVYQGSPTVSVPAYQPQISQPITQVPVYYQEQPNQPAQQAQVVNYPQVQAAQLEPQNQHQYQTQYQPQSQPQFQVQPQQQPQLQQQVDQQQQFAPPTPQVMTYSQVQSTLPEKQYQVQSQLEQQLQSQYQVQSQLEQQSQPQFQIQYQFEQQQQPQVQVQPQLEQQQQTNSQYQTQQQLQLQPQQQFDFESVFRPSRVPVRQAQVAEYDTQRQGPFGQKEGIFVYYPNGIITDDKDRPSIANRFNQAFDRFGQAISNLGNRQPSTIDTSVPRSKEGRPVKDKVKGSLLKVSSVLKSKKKIDKKTPDSTSESEIKQDELKTSPQ